MLQCCADVDFALVADIRDTRFARDPFELMHRAASQYQLFINTERNNWWMQDRFREINHTVPDMEVGMIFCMLSSGCIAELQPHLHVGTGV